mgnify:FL=1
MQIETSYKLVLDKPLDVTYYACRLARDKQAVYRRRLHLLLQELVFQTEYET